MRNIIAIKHIQEFYEKHPNSKTSLENWIATTKKAIWKKSTDVVADFNDADPIKDNRVVFNIAHNKYRLIAKISYKRQWVFIKFIGTHTDYDKINANTVDKY